MKNSHEQIDTHNALIETKLKMLCKQMGIPELVVMCENAYGQTIVLRYSKQSPGTPLFIGTEQGIKSGVHRAINQTTLYG